ncbi:MAG: hypothetical protein NC299_05205 [Lachnospiraceae bacterium]|nr:hypothetical protein [Ruminococcus sp.]MCM1274749.1 hypothetical protein [Lachnospiraceae bacterium]
MSVEYAARGEGLFTVFRVSENLFVLPNEYIADIRNMDDVTNIAALAGCRIAAAL